MKAHHTEPHKAVQPLAEAFGLLMEHQDKKEVRDALNLLDQSLKILENHMTVKKVSQRMVMHWVGSDHDSKEALLGLLVELANGDYTPEQFRTDVLDLAGDLNHA